MDDLVNSLHTNRKISLKGRARDDQGQEYGREKRINEERIRDIPPTVSHVGENAENGYCSAQGLTG